MPSPIPETRQSLLMRIKNPHNADAWREFDAIYRPAVYRFAQRRGLQRQDAEDIAQQVFSALCKKIGDWEPDQHEGSFRAWLLTVARNATTNKLTRKTRDAGQGGTNAFVRFAELIEENDTAELDWELRRAVFRRAAADIRPEFRDSTWLAYWQTAVDQKTAEDVANELRLSIGAVYTAKCRVLKRIRQQVKELGYEEI